MSELKQIVELWKYAKSHQEEICLATVVRTEGSSYRKPGARMLLTRNGRRAGTVSGGCLEGEVAKKAWWLTESGPVIQRYSSFYDDDSPMPYGLGCGGTVYVLLERGAAAHAVLDALQENLETRRAFVIATDTNRAQSLLVQRADGMTLYSNTVETIHAVDQALQEQQSFYAGDAPELFIEYIAPPTLLTIFGAGDDAKPLAEFSKRLGWDVVVADGRANLARAERFPAVNKAVALDYAAPVLFDHLEITQEGAYVLMTHSYEQDHALLRELLPVAPRYLGILGPRQRTQRLIREVASEIHLAPEECLARLYSPVGFDIGAHTPESIALSIASEIFAVLNGKEGLSLRKRASGQPVHA